MSDLQAMKILIHPTMDLFDDDAKLRFLGMINRFMGMNFCFNENHKKSQFCVTSSKRSIEQTEEGDAVNRNHCKTKT